MAISSARQFFDQTVAGGAAFLENLVTERAHETEWLDFKGGGDDPGSEQVKGLWSKAICGFANNQGGCIVWGIDARRDENGVDAASEVKLVQDPAALRSRLTQLQPNATEPPLAGVQSAVIPSGHAGAGFVVSYIPESDNKPHRAEHLKGTPYTIRIGDSFINPSPSILRNLFYPRSAPRLQISLTCEWQEPPNDVEPEIELFYRLFVRNVSGISARDIFVIAKCFPLGLQIECPYRTTKTETEFGVGIEVEKVLHPFSQTPLGAYRQRVRTWVGPNGRRPHVDSRAFTAYFQVFANDMLPSRQQVALGDFDVDRRVSKEAVTVPEFDPEFYSDAIRRS
jgi:hypothetical protein